jgi:hypothetical protein
MSSELVPTLKLTWSYEDYTFSHILSLDRFGAYFTDHYFKGYKLEKPDNLYKYFSDNKVSLSSLEKSYFWLSHPSKFNDPFDCMANREELILKKSSPSDKITLHRKNIGVSCFSLDNDSAIMWGHYANKFSGFAIEYEFGKIHQHENVDIVSHVSYLEKYKPSGFIDSYNKLIEDLYSTNLPDDVKLKMNNMVMILYEYCWKQKEWSYENEYRLISIASEKFGRKLFFNKNQIKSLYIGYKMPLDNKDYYHKLLEIMKTNYPSAEIYLVKPNSLYASLNFTRI